jgi:hypothetical protein
MSKYNKKAVGVTPDAVTHEGVITLFMKGIRGV